MKINKIKKLKVNSHTFTVLWDNTHDGGSFDFADLTINIGTKNCENDRIFMILCHELMEIVACEMMVRFRRPDCLTDYIFVYDHRQHETMMNMLAGLLAQFTK